MCSSFNTIMPPNHSFSVRRRTSGFAPCNKGFILSAVREYASDRCSRMSEDDHFASGCHFICSSVIPSMARSMASSADCIAGDSLLSGMPLILWHFPDSVLTLVGKVRSAREVGLDLYFGLLGPRLIFPLLDRADQGRQQNRASTQLLDVFHCAFRCHDELHSGHARYAGLFG